MLKTAKVPQLQYSDKVVDVLAVQVVVCRRCSSAVMNVAVIMQRRGGLANSEVPQILHRAV